MDGDAPPSQQPESSSLGDDPTSQDADLGILFLPLDPERPTHIDLPPLDVQGHEDALRQASKRKRSLAEEPTSPALARQTYRIPSFTTSVPPQPTNAFGRPIAPAQPGHQNAIINHHGNNAGNNLQDKYKDAWGNLNTADIMAVHASEVRDLKRENARLQREMGQLRRELQDATAILHQFVHAMRLRVNRDLDHMLESFPADAGRAGERLQ